MSKGKFSVVGLGPGDSQLLTHQATSVLCQAQVVVAVQAEKKDSMSFAIARPWLPKAFQRIALELDMGRDNQKSYLQVAKEIKTKLECGLRVVFLCEGDPCFYASAGHLLAALSDIGMDPNTVEVINSISAPHYACALLQKQLATRDEALVIIPAQRPDADIKNYLDLADNLVIIKLGRHTERIWELIHAQLRHANCYYVANLGWENQLLEKAPKTAPKPCYFSMFLVLSS